MRNRIQAEQEATRRLVTLMREAINLAAFYRLNRVTIPSPLRRFLGIPEIEPLEKANGGNL